MKIRRQRALGGKRRQLYLSYKRIIAFKQHEAAVMIQKNARRFLVRVPLRFLRSDKYIVI